MVPVYFVDRPATDGRDGEQVRIAVNGQTGRAAAVVFSDKRETHVVAPLNPSLHLSGESTVHATPIEVKYVKSPFLYQIVRRGGGEQPRQVAAVSRGFLPRRKAQTQGLARCDLWEVGKRSTGRLARVRWFRVATCRYPCTSPLVASLMARYSALSSRASSSLLGRYGR